MAVVLTRAETFSNVFKWLGFPADDYHFEYVTVNLAAGATLAQGTVLSKLAANGKYIVQDASLASGLGLEASAILVGTDENNPGATFATTTDKKVLVLARGPAKVAREKLVYGAGTNTAAEIAAAEADLNALGILAVTQI